MSASRAAPAPRGGAMLRSLYVVVPVVLLLVAEITVIVAMSETIGWWTLPLLIGTTVLGAYLLQREWTRAWRGLGESLRTGSLPPGATADAVLALIGGLLLIAPGFITDVVGLLLLLPFTRPWVRQLMGWWAGRALAKGGPADSTPRVVKGEVVDDPASTTLIPGIEE